MTSQRSRANAPRAGKHGRKRINLKKFLIRVAVDKKILHSQHVKKKINARLNIPSPVTFLIVLFVEKTYCFASFVSLFLSSSTSFTFSQLPSHPLSFHNPHPCWTGYDWLIRETKDLEIIRSSFRELSGKALLHSYIERNRFFSVIATQGKKCSMYRCSVNVNYIQIAFTLSLFNAWRTYVNEQCKLNLAEFM